ncbi:MAG: hypothetical protein IPN72_10960 [Saprospiraceae bacterium]|nr:hypothetical protein [Saprospiraceae bacterium]
MEKKHLLNEEYSTQQILTLSQISKGLAIRKKGILERSGLMLALKKIGISDEEFKDLNVKSFKHNKKVAELYERSILEHPLPITSLANEFDLEIKNRINSIPLNYLGPNSWQTGSLKVFPDNPWAHATLSTEGLGDDYFTGTYTETKNSNVISYLFGASVAGIYGFSMPVFVTGQYFLVADDGLCEDKYVDFAISAYVRISKTSKPWAKTLMRVIHFPLIHQRITNEAVKDVLAKVIEFRTGGVTGDYLTSLPFEFTLNIADLVNVEVFFTMYSQVAGRGSIQKAFFDLGNGGMYSPQMEVVWLSNNK